MKWPGRQAPPSPEERAREQMRAALEIVAHTPAEQAIEALQVLVNTLRPVRASDVETATLRLRALTALVAQSPPHRAALRGHLVHLLADKQALHLYADSGILSSEGFFAGVWRRLGSRLLPDAINRASLRDSVRLIFWKETDPEWVDGAPAGAWVALADALDIHAAAGAEAARAPVQLLDAIQVISYRITALGLEPELVRNHPAIERYESPFLMQNVEVRQFIDEHKAALAEKRAATLDDKHLQVLLDQCRQIVQKVRRQSEKGGASISLTYLLVRIEQNLGRMALLLRLFEERPDHERNIDSVALFQAMVRAVCRRNDIGELWNQTTALLAQRIVGHAGKAGEAYITATRAEYFALCRSAAGAGLLVALAAFIKLWMAEEPHAPMGEAILYSANYAWCFMLMSALHFSLATKQPAMTANRIAHSLDADERGRDRLDGLAELVIRTLRSQFIAVAGNFLLVIPLPVVLSMLVLASSGTHYIPPERAQALLGEVEPLSATTWVWAAITGVWLFLCGLISGYYDNKAVYDRIPQRLELLRPLRRLLGVARAKRFAAWMEEHLGALAGSFFFGIMLGSTGALGDILGLPLDTLHVTFSTANTFFALSALDWDIGAAQAGRLALGIAIVGTLNLGVSFGLALYVAMRAQRVEFGETLPLLRKLGLRLLRTPRDFILPPRELPAPPSVGRAGP